MEVKTVKTSTKCIIISTTQHVEEHREKQFIYLRQRRGRNTHPEKSAGVLLNEEGEEDTYITIYLSLISGSSFWPLFSPSQSSCFISHI